MDKTYKKVKKEMWVLTIKSTGVNIPGNGKLIFSHRQNAIEHLKTHGGNFWIGNAGKVTFKLVHKKVKVYMEVK